MLKWREDFYHDADTTDIEKLSAWFTDDVQVRFGNQPALYGKSAAVEAFAGFFGSIAGMHHELGEAHVNGETLVSEALVTYTRHDGSSLTVPACSVLRRDGELISSLVIYIDLSQLW